MGALSQRHERPLIVVDHPDQHLAAVEPEAGNRFGREARKAIVDFSRDVHDSSAIHAPRHDPVIQKGRTTGFLDKVIQNQQILDHVRVRHHPVKIRTHKNSERPPQVLLAVPH